MNIDRRQFIHVSLTSAAAVGGLGCLSSAAVADATERTPIIDTHQHLWDLD